MFERTLADDAPLKALFQLDAWWSSRLDESAEQAGSGLSPVEFDLHVFVLYVGEVGNGGHSQFFENPSGRHSAAVLSVLERLGLTDLHDLFAEACAVFPSSTVPQAHDERTAAIARLSDAHHQRWDALDKRFYAADRAAERRALDYARRHRDGILVPERA